MSDYQPGRISPEEESMLDEDAEAGRKSDDPVVRKIWGRALANAETAEQRKANERARQHYGPKGPYWNPEKDKTDAD